MSEFVPPRPDRPAVAVSGTDPRADNPGSGPTPVTLIRAGVRPLAEVDAEMRRLQPLRIAGAIPDTLIIAEHPEIVTLGRRVRRDGIPPPEGYDTCEVDRGGGLTWHGPGQLAVYPIFHWSGPGERSVSGAIDRIEEWIIRALARLGVAGVRDPRMHGVWCLGHKIASIGLSFSHWVTRHGFTVNLDTPAHRVEAFAGCGLAPGTTTSLARLVGRLISPAEMERALLAELAPLLGRAITRTLDQPGPPPWEVAE
jgi:lipoate-protein ligase B